MSERLYRIALPGSDGNVRSLPSVTTITRMIHSYGLERYKLRLVAEIARTCPMDWSPDRILTAALDEGGAAAKAGTRQHELADLVHGAASRPVTTAEAAMMDLISSFFQRWGLDVLAREMAVASMAEGWAGRLDRVVRLRQDIYVGAERIPAGAVVMLDIKSGKAVQGEVALQLQGYALADTALVGSASLYDSAPLPDWWPEISQTWGLVAHLRLDGAQALVPVRLSHGGEGRTPLDMLRLCRTAWEWDRYERDKLLAQADEFTAPLTVEAVADALGAVEIIDEMAQYQAELWAWLEAVVREAREHSADAIDRIASRWPVGVASFGQVRKGVAPLPDLHAMRLVEEVIAEATTRYKVAFHSVARPLAPRGATFDVAPEAVVAIDSPHPLDVEEFRLEWEATHKRVHPRRKIPALPSIATRRTLAHYRQQLSDYVAANTAEAMA